MAPVKVLMVAGHFASGKTSLAIKMVDALTRKGYSVGLLLNDIGPVDYRMVASMTNYPVEEVSRHCLCTKPGELKEALRKLLAAGHDIIVIETIGFADPHKCWTTLSEVLPTIFPQHELGAITVVVDGELLVRMQRSQGPSFKPILAQQIPEAEIIAISKVDLLGLESLNPLKEAVSKLNDRAKIVFVSALTGTGLEGLVEISMASKWSQSSRKSSDASTSKRSEWCSSMDWSSYVVNLQLESSETITEVVGKTLLEMGRGIAKRHGETIRIKAYCDNPLGKVYLSINPDLRIEYRPGAYTGDRVKGLKFTVSCIARGIDANDITEVVKEALAHFDGSFLLTKL